MNNKHVWSPSLNLFFPADKREKYVESGWDLTDVIDIEDNVSMVFISPPPNGKVRGVGTDGMPCWVDIPTLPNVDLLRMELELMSSIYHEDINALNQAYLAAVVSDGPGEPAKQQAVRDAITARKAQYAADKEAARLKYPV